MNNLITFDSIFDQIMMHGVKYVYLHDPKAPKKWMVGIVDCILISTEGMGLTSSRHMLDSECWPQLIHY